MTLRGRTITIGAVTALVAAILGVLVEFGVPLTAKQVETILVVIAALGPILAGAITTQTEPEPNGRHAMTNEPGTDLPDPADREQTVPEDQTPAGYTGDEWDDSPSDEDTEEQTWPTDDLEATEDYGDQPVTGHQAEHGEPETNPETQGS